MVQKTYWHLLDRRRVPAEYELVSSKLLYYTTTGFEVQLPLLNWYAKYRQGSPLTCTNWEEFTDPRRTTYSSYMDIQSTQECFVDGLLKSIETTGYDRGLKADWIERLRKLFAPVCYPLHGFQMIACYMGQMAPSGRIVLAAMFQAADEIRRIQRITYRRRQLQLARPEFGDGGKLLWQQDPAWQPLRQAVEQLLVTYDWGEAFAGLNLVLKPLVDKLFMRHLGELARIEGDYILPQILLSLEEDCRWQREWTQTLVRMIVEDTPANLGVLEGWTEKWYALASRALDPLVPLFGQSRSEGFAGGIASQLRNSLTGYLSECGLRGTSPAPAAE
jgi:toluene monooxygenase system protein E